MNYFSKLFLTFSFSLIFTATLFSQVSNSQCYLCHSNTTLKKTITLASTTETVPLYVDSTKFKTSKHAALRCVNCHTDISETNLYSHKLTKYYGGWARFSAKDDNVTAGQEKTRNYTTMAAKSCNQNGCHASKAAFEKSTHNLTFKQKHASLRTVNGESVGEAYVNNDCNRCHSTCATCHFKSDIKQYETGDVLSIWNQLQSSGDGAEPLKTQANNLTQYQMDWTTNVESHTFLTASNLKANNDVCQTCHIGYYKPPMNGFLSLEAPYPKAFGTNIKRHPQIQEGIQSAVHKNFKCADCHTDIHSFPGDRKTDWQIDGDVTCQKCHYNPPHLGFPNYSKHTTVDCISCHFRGFVKSTGQTGHDLWRVENKPTGRVRPLAMKYNEAVSWYPHNIEKPGNSVCATKCHYQGNLLGVSVITSVKEHASIIPSKFDLSQNYPNPFNPVTNIGYTISQNTHVKLEIFDALGKTIKTLVNENHAAGSYSVQFNAGALTSGIYFYKLTTPNFTSTKKLLLMK